MVSDCAAIALLCAVVDVLMYLVMYLSSSGLTCSANEF